MLVRFSGERKRSVNSAVTAHKTTSEMSGICPASFDDCNDDGNFKSTALKAYSDESDEAALHLSPEGRGRNGRVLRAHSG